MKILHRNVDRNTGEGTIKLEAEQADDMYHLYNLIAEGDTVETSTMRNVTHESKTGSIQKERIRMLLCISVERVEYDSEQGSLRVAGKNVKENDHVKMGQYHTLTIEINQVFIVYKLLWDTVYMERIKDASDPCAKADIASIVMQEGLAHICLITPFLTQTRARIERNMPKKRDGYDKHSKAMSSFFSDIYEAMIKYINFDIVQVVLCGSPGFLKDDFYTYILDRVSKNASDGNGMIRHIQNKFVCAHATSGHKKAIDEMLSVPEIASRLGDVKAAGDVKALQEFYQMMDIDEDR